MSDFCLYVEGLDAWPVILALTNTILGSEARDRMVWGLGRSSSICGCKRCVDLGWGSLYHGLCPASLHRCCLTCGDLPAFYFLEGKLNYSTLCFPDLLQCKSPPRLLMVVCLRCDQKTKLFKIDWQGSASSCRAIFCWTQVWHILSHRKGKHIYPDKEHGLHSKHLWTETRSCSSKWRQSELG